MKILNHFACNLDWIQIEVNSTKIQVDSNSIQNIWGAIVD
jgi:hypothetical protein